MRPRGAQSTVEYGVAVAAVIIAIVVMQTYAKRGLQGRYKDLVDSATKKATAEQYEPYYENTSVYINSSIARNDKVYPNDKRDNAISQKYNYTLTRGDSFESD